MPTFEVRLKGDRGVDPPLIKIGVFSRHIEQDVFTTVPFDTERKDLYQFADNFAIWINRREYGWDAQVNRQHLYNDYRMIHWEFRQHQHFPPVLGNQDTINEILSSYQIAHNAETKAKALLNEMNPELCKKVDSGGAFYLQGARYIFIVNPVHKKVDVLFPDGPKSLCVYIKDPTVQTNKYDWTLAMWKYLSGAEEHVLKTANHFDFYLTGAQEVTTLAQETSDNPDTESGESVNNLLEGTRQTGTEVEEGRVNPAEETPF